MAERDYWREQRTAARGRIQDAWGELEQVFIDGGTSAEWIVCATELWKQIDAVLPPSPTPETFYDKRDCVCVTGPNAERTRRELHDVPAPPRCELLVGATSETCDLATGHPGDCSYGEPGWRSDNEHDAEAAAMERLLEVTAYNLHGACLVGNPAPRVARMYERMTAPQVGDLVLEITTIWDASRAGTRLGRLLRQVREPVYTPEVWAENGGGDEPIPTEPIWYIELTDGREFRWHNASFIAVFTEIATHDRPLVSDAAPVLALLQRERQP